MKMVQIRSSWVLGAGLLVALASGVAQAQTLVSREGVQVTAQDLMVGADGSSGEGKRNPAYAQPERVRQTVSNILVRRVLVNRAVQEGLERDPRIQAALQQARDRVLSDAMLAKMDQASKPPAAMIEGYARNLYMANAKRFETPEEVRVRHMLVKKDAPDAKAKALAWLQALKGGASFEELARAESQDAGSAARGGDLGYVSKGRTVKPFEDAAFALQKSGDLSDVVESQFGFHVIQLVDRKPAGRRSFDEVKDGLIRETEAALANDARSKEQERILQDARFDDKAIESFSESQR